MSAASPPTTNNAAPPSAAIVHALAHPPPGEPFSPAIASAYLEHVRVQAAPSHAPTGTQPDEFIAVTGGARGDCVTSAAQAEADVSGRPGAARRRFTDEGEALYFVNTIKFGRAVNNIPALKTALGSERDNMASAATQIRLVNTNPLVQPLSTAVSSSIRVEATRMHHAMRVIAPNDLTAIVGDHRIHISCDPPVSLVDDTLAFPVRSSARGETFDTFGQSALPVYSSTPNIAPIAGERDEEGFTFVAPHAMLVTEDAAPTVRDNTLTLVEPLPYVPRTEEADALLYWVVLQGWQVGIFKATRDDMRNVLPAGLSVAKAFYTLEEASFFWHRELELGWKLTQVVPAEPIEEQVAGALRAAPPGNEALAGAFLRAMHGNV